MMDKSSYFFLKGLFVILKSSKRKKILLEAGFVQRNQVWHMFKWKFCTEVFFSAQLLSYLTLRLKI